MSGDISKYVNMALNMSKNPIGRMTIKGVIKQYAPTVGIDSKILSDVILHALDELNTKIKEQ